MAPFKNVLPNEITLSTATIQSFFLLLSQVDNDVRWSSDQFGRIKATTMSEIKRHSAA